MRHCLTLALPIVSLSLCLLSRFLANNGNDKLSLDEYFVHQQIVIDHLWSWREGARLLRPIDWLRNVCGRNTTEQRKPLKSVLRGTGYNIYIYIYIY